MNLPRTSSYSFSRRQMYEKIESFVRSHSLGMKCLFVGEDGTSGIIGMLEQDKDIVITNKIECNIMKMPYENESFDIVVSDQVLEHVEDPFMAAHEMYRVTKYKGVTIVTSCFMNPIHCNDKSDCCEDYWRFTPDGLRVLCKKYTKIHQCDGMGDFKLLYHCLLGHRENKDSDGKLAEIAKGNDGKTYIHTWIIAEK